MIRILIPTTVTSSYIRPMAPNSNIEEKMIPRTLHASYLQSSRMALKNADSALFCIKVSIEKKRLWRIEWARYQWFNSQKNFDPIEAENPEPWYLQYQGEIELGKGINEDELGITITFSKDKKVSSDSHLHSGFVHLLSVFGGT